ncbi:MAG: DUF6077 domain-containing protein [Erysipelotrichaceae bacterium]|nr:DUF6077 domain-containing protein [Erysipelotrichaceae bacterium]
MKYFVVPILLMIYLELLGRSFYRFIDKKPLEFAFPIGFILMMAVTYVVGWPITAFNGNFYHLLILYGILILLSLVFILKNIRKIDLKIDIKWWVLFLVLTLFQTYMSYSRTLGEVHGYDCVYYFNTIGFNIGNTELNSLHPHFGTYPNLDIQWITYVFQSFYYVVAVYIYVFEKSFSLIGSTFELVPGYVWTFQILLNAFFVSTSLMCIKEFKIKNKLLNLSLIILLILFMNNFYWNNAFGFIGNNYRMSVHALATLYLYRYVKDKDLKNLYIVILCMLGMCGLSSTGTFATVFLLFGLFFYLFDKEKNTLKIIAVSLLIPLINISVVKLGQHLYAVILPAVACAIVYFLNDFILKLYQNKYLRYGTIALVFIALYGLSVITSGNLIDLSMFFNNYSEIADMSWDYFYFPDLKHYIFNILLLGTASFYFVKNRKDPLTIVSVVLILTFFNPLCSYFVNMINWVYYRCYDIIINQYTMVLFIYFLIECFKKDIYKNIVSGVLLLISVYLAAVQIPCYWHPTFKPDEDYNYVYKIENKEIEICLNVRNLVNELGLENPKIIAPNFYMPTFIRNGEYLYGKEKRYNWNQYSEDTYGLYVIFFPKDGVDNFMPPDDPLYPYTLEFLESSGYDILVVPYDKYYYNWEDGKTHPIIELIETKYQPSDAGTDTYAVYYLK